MMATLINSSTCDRNVSIIINSNQHTPTHINRPIIPDRKHIFINILFNHMRIYKIYDRFDTPFVDIRCIVVSF